MNQPWTLGDVLWVVVLVGGFLITMHLAQVQREARAREFGQRPRAAGRPLWRRVALWIALWWILAAVPVVFAQAGEPAYITADPGTSTRVGLATLDGRYSITLSDSCDGVEPGASVLMSTDYSVDPSVLELQVVDPIAGTVSDSVCTVVDQVLRSTVPCDRNGAGQCDVAY